MYENYPFWHTFFTKLGFRVVLSPASTRKIYEMGIESIPSESECYPAKLAHGHIEWLLREGVKFIFYPSVAFERKEFPDAGNHYNCPIVTSYSENIKNNVEGLNNPDIKFMNPFLSFESMEIISHRLVEEFATPEFKLSAEEVTQAARDAWKVMPELMVQHAINSWFSEKSGILPNNISLSTVPPTASPIPTLRYDLPYAVALRDFFGKYKMRAQMNTKYVTSSSREATVTHVLNMLISRLTNADIQSTITPDEGRNVPWHMFNIEACDTAKQTLVGLDGLMEMIDLKPDGVLRQKAREIKQRAILYLEEMIEMGGYFESVERGMFVDSGEYPERNGDGIARHIDGGIGAGTVYKREANYMAPVCAHFGYNNTDQYGVSHQDACDLIGGCTFDDRSKIQFIDELDPEDNVELRLKEKEAYRNTNLIMPEVQWLADGTVTVDLFVPVDQQIAKAAAIEIAEKMNLTEVEVIHVEVMHPSEGTRVQVKGILNHAVDIDKLEIPKENGAMSDFLMIRRLPKSTLK